MSVTAVPLQPVKTGFKVWLWLGVLAAVALAVGFAWLGTRASIAARGDNEQFLAWNASQPGVKSTESGLEYQPLKSGEGPNAVDGDVLTVTIIGRLRDGTVFQPEVSAPIQVGPGTIPGFTEALKLMNKGAKYRVWMPPKIAYDAVPAGSAPPELKGKLLIFDIEVTELMTAAEMQMQQMMQQQMMQQQLQGQGGAPEGQPPAAQ